MSDTQPITREEYESDREQVWAALKGVGNDLKGLTREVQELVKGMASAKGERNRVSTPTLIGVGGLLVAAAALLYPLIEDMRGDAEKGYLRNEQRIERLEQAQHDKDVAQDMAQRDERQRNDRIERDAGGVDMFIKLWMNGDLRSENKRRRRGRIPATAKHAVNRSTDMPRKTIPMAERFWAKVKIGDASECWEWQARKQQGGYGLFENTTAHRISYSLTHGPIGDGLDVDHKCGNRGCVNPSHLEAVTHRENMRRSNAFAGVNCRKKCCKNGHEFTPENTYITTRGTRYCRACGRIHQRRAHGHRPRLFP